MRTCPNCGHKTDKWTMREGLLKRYYFCPKCRNLIYTWDDEIRNALEELVNTLSEFFRIPQILDWIEKYLTKRGKK